MYIGFLLFLVLLLLLINIKKFVSLKIKKSICYTILILILVVFSITISALYLDLSFLGIYGKGIFFADGIRYLNEIILFKECPWCVDEYHGQYFDYIKSAKMGLPSLLAWLAFPFNIENINVYYMLNHFVFIIISVVSLFVFNEILELKQVNSKIQFYFFIFIVLFPSDLYWLTRFLREPTANAFFLLFTLISILMVIKNKNYLFYLFVVLIFLILFRAQLAMLASITLFTLLLLHRQKARYVWISILFMIISFKQTIIISGTTVLYKILNMLIFKEGIMVIKYIIVSLISVNITLIIAISLLIVLSTYFKNNSIKKYNLDLYKIKVLFFINLIIALILYQSLNNMQIRFIYPFISYFKLLLIFKAIDMKTKLVRGENG